MSETTLIVVALGMLFAQFAAIWMMWQLRKSIDELWERLDAIDEKPRDIVVWPDANHGQSSESTA